MVNTIPSIHPAIFYQPPLGPVEGHGGAGAGGQRHVSYIDSDSLRRRAHCNAADRSSASTPFLRQYNWMPSTYWMGVTSSHRQLRTCLHRDVFSIKQSEMLVSQIDTEHVHHSLWSFAPCLTLILVPLCLECHRLFLHFTSWMSRAAGQELI